MDTASLTQPASGKSKPDWQKDVGSRHGSGEAVRREEQWFRPGFNTTERSCLTPAGNQADPCNGRSSTVTTRGMDPSTDPTLRGFKASASHAETHSLGRYKAMRVSMVIDQM